MFRGSPNIFLSPVNLDNAPFLLPSSTRKGKSSIKLVKKEDLPAVRKHLKNYGSIKLLMERWIDLATELSTLRLTKETSFTLMSFQVEANNSIQGQSVRLRKPSLLAASRGSPASNWRATLGRS